MCKENGENFTCSADMPNSLRDRIAAAIMQTCHGVYMDDAVDAADAVIAELGLHRSSSFISGDDGTRILVSEWDRQWMKTPAAGWESRYLTDWKADDE